MEISWGPPWRLRWPTIRITSRPRPMKLRHWFRNIVADIWTLHELINTVVQWYERETSVIYSCYSCSCKFHMLSGMPWIWILFVLYMHLSWHVHWLFINITAIYIHARVLRDGCWWVVIYINNFILGILRPSCSGLVFCKQIQYCNWLSHYLGKLYCNITFLIQIQFYVFCMQEHVSIGN